MNRIYRIIWSRITKQWIVVSETTHMLHSGSNRQHRELRLLATSLLLGSLAMGAQASPQGGQVSAGQGSIAQSGATTTITQTSANLSVNWQSFNVTANETVNFVQPSASSVAVNRVIGSNQASQIAGHLNANGQVWLINPNGVQFSNSAVVNVGALIASTLNISDSQINQQQRQFSGQGTGSVINQGQINAADGGYVAFISNVVSNQGNILANKGAVALAAGDQVTLSFSGNQLINVVVDASTLNNLAENKQLIQANGGMVMMTAGAHDSLLASVVNNSGIIEAETLGGQQGNITLLAGMTAGTTNVAGTIDASALNGGDGGHIETSAAYVNIADNAKISTESTSGATGSWLLDPFDYTIAASGGDITGAQLSSLLSTNNIIISTTQGSSGVNGDLFVSDAISWSNSNSLTLNAVRNVTFNSGSSVTNTGGGTLNVRADLNGTGTGTITTSGTINVSGTGGAINFYYNPALFGTASTFSNTNVTAGPNAVFTPYMLVNSAANLQNISANPSGNYALGASINLSSISFTPIASFSGNFDGQSGLGYSISNLTINTNAANVGLFSSLSNSNATMRNLTITNANVTNNSTSNSAATGILAGSNAGNITNVSVNGSLTGAYNTGGLVGKSSSGTLTNDAANVNMAISFTGTNNNVYSGGLVGQFSGGSIINASSAGTMTVTGQNSNYFGGLVGSSNGSITQSQSTMLINAATNYYVGGLAGYSNATISNSWASGNITGGSSQNDSQIGGLVGYNDGNINNSYAQGNVISGGSYTGGFAGTNTGNITNSYASGNVTATGTASTSQISRIGGLIGINKGSASTSNSYATGNVNVDITANTNGNIDSVGGLIGGIDFISSVNVTHSYATGNVTATASPTNGLIINVGGLVGYYYGNNSSTLSYSYASGAVTASGKNVNYIGGLAGDIFNATLINCYAVGVVNVTNVVTGNTNIYGLAYLNGGTVTGTSYWDNTPNSATTNQTPQNANVIGLSDSAMQQQTSFSGWSFGSSNTWTMGTGSYPYPIFSSAAGTSGTIGYITPTTVTSYYPLSVQITSVNGKQYDGNTSATTNGSVVSGMISGDTVTLGNLTGTFASPNANTNIVVNYNAPTTISNLGYTYIASLVAAAGTGTINPAPLTISTATGVNKIYDGTNTANVNLVINPAGLVGSDTITATANAAFDSINAATGIHITINSVTLSGSTPSNYVISSTPTNASADILQKNLTLTAVGQNKIYDDTNTATAVLTVNPADLVGSDSVTASAAATFASVNAGNNIGITLGAITLGGTGSNNYTVNTIPSGISANIDKKSLTLTTVAQSKTYDGNNSATVSLTISPTEMVGSDSVTASTSATFNSINAANGIAITLGTINLSGSSANNYTLGSVPTGITADITPKALTLAAAGQNKVYDGNNSATVTLTVNPAGLVGSDTISASANSATFVSVNAANGIQITIAGVTLAGSTPSNYSVSIIPVANANIEPKPITISVQGQGKTYDGTNSASVILGINPADLVGSDTLAATSNPATFSSKNVGTVNIDVNNISLTGTSSGNYMVLNPSATTSAQITPKNLTVIATGQNKVIDGTTNASVILSSPDKISTDNLSLTSDPVTISGTSTGTYPVTVTGITLGGTDSSNYNLINTTANTSITVLPINSGGNGGGGSNRGVPPGQETAIHDTGGNPEHHSRGDNGSNDSDDSSYTRWLVNLGDQCLLSDDKYCVLGEYAGLHLTRVGYGVELPPIPAQLSKMAKK